MCEKWKGEIWGARSTKAEVWETFDHVGSVLMLYRMLKKLDVGVILRVLAPRTANCADLECLRAIGAVPL